MGNWINDFSLSRHVYLCMERRGWRMSEHSEYVIMFPDGTLYVAEMLIILFMYEADIEFEELGYL